MRIKRTLQDLLSRQARLILAGALLGAVPVAVPASAAPDQEEQTEKKVPWETELDQAVETARTEEKRVLLRFTADWCPPCRVMDASVWPEEKVIAAVADGFVPVEVDIDQKDNRPLVLRYGIRTIPALVLIEPDGTEISRGGFMSAEELVRFLEKFSQKRE